MPCRFHFTLLSVVAICCLQSPAFAYGDLLELSLEDLLNTSVSVGSKTETKTLRETPGIVTVITADDIANSGARDLIDLLRLVPGYSIGLDVYEVTGPGVRGNWAYEGKVLLLIDGIEFNDRQYGTLPLGNHFPLDNIQRIEIIRGPGSVNYGGFAELGVINIITRNAAEMNGSEVSVAYGQMRDDWGRRTLNVMHGQRLDNGLEVTASAYTGNTRRSDREYVSLSGMRQDMAESSHLDPLFINLGLRSGEFTSRLLYDNYRTTYRNRYGEVEDLLWHVNFKSLSYQAQYAWQLSSTAKLDVEAGYYDEHAWQEDMADPELAINYRIQRYWAKAGLKQRFSDILKVATGLELSRDESSDDSPLTDENLPSYTNYTLYAEGDYTAPWFNFIVGARFDKHSIFGTKLAPRIALTKVYGDFHYKLLYSHSFRTPAVLNISYNDRLQPEKAEVWEVELGYKFSKTLNLTVNLFDNQMDDTITYGVDPLTSEDTYFNATTTGTRGIEAEFRWQHKGGYLILSHAYYEVAHGAADNQRVLNFQDGSEDRKAIVGMPQHKTTLSAHAQLTPTLSLNPTLIWRGAVYAYDSLDADENPVLRKYGDQVLCNLFLRYQPPALKNLEIDLGIYDVLGNNPLFIQPFNGGSAPLPGPSREWLLKLRYRF